MRSRCRRDIRLFARVFFAHHARLPFGRMHRELFRLYRAGLHLDALADRPMRRRAVAAPRGAAKTTLTTLIFPLHATLYGLERYVLIVSATLKQARQRLRNLRAEIEGNRLLHHYFGEELRAGARPSRTLKALEVNGVRLEVFSAGTELRGVSHGPWRPTLILLDDVEDSRAARSLERRERLEEWYNEVVENLGDRYTRIEIVGTILHPDSLLSRLLRRPDYESRVFRSIERFAERSDLWEQWRGLYTDLADARRLETARDFFNRRRADMLRGSRVLWQAKEDYYELMCQMTTKGRAAFFKEKQNEPGAAEDAFFDLARAARFRIDRDRIVDLPRETHAAGAAP